MAPANISKPRVVRLGILCRALIRRFQNIPEAQWNEPVEGGFSEFGYTDDIQLRLLQHTRQSSSNYLMNLFDALALHLLNDRYIFEQYAIYHIPIAHLVELLEIYFTRAGQGYASNGGGLSVAGAGRSTNSRNNYTEEDYQVFWDYNKPLRDGNVKQWNAFMHERYRQKLRRIEEKEAENLALEALLQERDRLKAQYEEEFELLPEEIEAIELQTRSLALLQRCNDLVKASDDSQGE